MTRFSNEEKWFSDYPNDPDPGTSIRLSPDVAEMEIVGAAIETAAASEDAGLLFIVGDTGENACAALVQTVARIAREKGVFVVFLLGLPEEPYRYGGGKANMALEDYMAVADGIIYINTGRLHKDKRGQNNPQEPLSILLNDIMASRMRRAKA